MQKAILATTMLVLTSVAAAAQFAPGQPTTTIPAQDIFSSLQPLLMAVATAAAAVITALAGYGIAWLRKKLNLTDAEAEQLGLQNDASHRDALQVALTNAAGAVLNKLGNDIKGKTIDVRNPAVQQAITTVLKAAPDAIKYFDLDKYPDAIAEKIVAKIPQVANTAPPAA